MRNTMARIIVLGLIAWYATAALGDEPGKSGRLVLVAGGGTGGDGTLADRAELNAPFGIGFNAREHSSSWKCSETVSGCSVKRRSSRT